MQTSAGSGGDALCIAAYVLVEQLTQLLPQVIAFPLTVIARMSRLLDQQNVDTQGRWLVVDPVFMEVLKDEDSRLFNADFGGSGFRTVKSEQTFMVSVYTLQTIYHQ